MLSAGKQEMPSDVPTSSPASTAKSFGKVLSSIQGLQQRLDDFSIEEVSRAHAKANALMQQLDDFHNQLTALAKLREAVTRANRQISAIPDENLDLIGTDGLEHHPRLRAIIQVGKLVRMHRSLREAQASANSDFLALEHRPARADFSVEDTSAPSHAFSLPEIDASASAENGLESTLGDENIQNEAELAAMSPSKSGAAPLPSPELNAANLLPANICAPSKQPPAASPIAEPKTLAKPDFDQRLLNDLIETYGEFTIAAVATSPVESQTMIPQKLADPRASADLISVETTPAEPAFVRSAPGGRISLPPPEAKPSQRHVPKTSPSLKKQGEIDRQLKRIIKDYGEYDLYSPQKSMNLKMAAIAVLALLGLALGSFYFFKPSTSAIPAAMESDSPPGITGAPKEGR